MLRGSSTQSSPPSDNSLNVPSGDPGWTQFVLCESRFRAAEADIAQKSEIYQPESKALRDAVSLRSDIIIERGQIALKLLPKCQIAFDDLKGEYTKRLSEMKPNHPDMQALDLAIKNYEVLKESLLQAVKTSYVNSMQSLLKGAQLVEHSSARVGRSLRYEESQITFSIKDVTLSGIQTYTLINTRDSFTVPFDPKVTPRWQNNGVYFANSGGNSSSGGRDYYICKSEWTGDHPKVALLIKYLTRIRDPLCYLSYDEFKPQDASQATRLLQLEVNKVSWNIQRIKELIRAGGDVNTCDKKIGWSPVHFAAYNNDTELMKLCLGQAGSDVNAFDKVGRSPLHLAVSKTNNSPVVRVLLGAGANVNAPRKENKSPFSTSIPMPERPLHIAIQESGDPEIVKVLLDAGADVNTTCDATGGQETPLIQALRACNSKIVELLLVARAKVDSPPRCFAMESDGLMLTELLSACRSYGYSDSDLERSELCNIIKALVNAGANVNVTVAGRDGMFWTTISSIRGTFYSNGSLYKPKPLVSQTLELYNFLRAAGARE
jgi:ankyrin repeat protein